MWVRAAVIGALGGAFALIGASPAAAKPCAKHQGDAKKACLTVQHEREARDKLRWPPRPVTHRDMVVRVPDWYRFVKLGRCEQPGPSKYGDGVNWSHPGPTWGGGVGLYRQTWYAAGSPYPAFSGSRPETILVADAIRDRFGITAWGAWRCF